MCSAGMSWIWRSVNAQRVNDFRVDEVVVMAREAPDPSGYYVVRCYECGHMMGQTDDPNDTKDMCERCQ